MDRNPFYLGEWQVTPNTNSIQNAGKSKQLEPKAMDVLCYLCMQNGEIISSDDLVSACWKNIDVGDNPLHKVITQLRKALGDKASKPTYIETIRKRGYRVIASLSFPFAEQITLPSNNWQGGSPFIGLSAYNTHNAHVFFGRNQHIANLLELLSNQIKHGRGFCLILGPSGTGKSSLVNAGVLPKLLNSKGYNGIGVLSYSQLDFADTDHQRVFLDLASAMLDWDINDLPVFDGQSAEQLSDRLQNNIDNVIHLISTAIGQHVSHFHTPQLFLFIDRLEVLLSAPGFTQDCKDLFLSIIDKLAKSKHIIVFSACRNDFYPLVVEQPSLMQSKLRGAHYDLTPPNRNELKQIIRLPALSANLTYSSDPDTQTPLDEILCTDTINNPDALPMLQYTLHELYLQRSENDELSYDVYKQLGGIEGAIGIKAEDIFIKLTNEQQQQLPYVMSLLVTLNPDGKTVTSRAARWEKLINDSQIQLVQDMVDSRLFVSHLQNNEACFSLAHEALLRQWPRAKQWINDHKGALTIKSNLQFQTQSWLKENKSNAYLLSQGKPLQDALALKNENIFELELNEIELIKSSIDKINRTQWFKRATITLLCVLSFTAILMSINSYQAQQVAQQKRLEAESLLGFMVGDFADKLRSVRRMDLLDGISNKALEYFSVQQDEKSLLGFINKEQNFKSRYQHAQTLNAMGEVAYSRNKLDEAHQAFESAEKILESLYTAHRENLDLLKTLGANSFWLGQLLYDEENYTLAQPYFEQYKQYSFNMIMQAPENIDAIIEMSDSQSTLGSLYLKLSKYDKARTAFEASLKYTIKALKEYPKDEYLLTNKADTYTWLASIEQNLGELTSALSLQEQAQQSYQDLLVDSPKNARVLEYLAHTYSHQARILMYLGKNQDAYSKIVLATQTIEQVLEQDPKNTDWILHVNLYHALKLVISEKVNMTDNSDSLIQNILASSPQYLVKQIDIFNLIIRFYQKTNNWQASQDLISKAVNLAEHVKQEIGLSDNYRHSAAELHLLNAKQAEHKNENSLTLQLCHFAAELLEPLVSKNTNVEDYILFTQAHSCTNTLNQINEHVNLLQRLQIKEYTF
jgi:DNA-binding winged helix-turn-helix (wHTH) protein/tetratricopeptide (TPR) repeat protein